MFEGVSNRKYKVLAAILAVCLIIACVPTVFADAVGSSSGSGAPSSGGFATLNEDGGLLLVGTARIPNNGSDPAAVKFIYSDSLVLNEKSINLIRSELRDCGMTISEEMMVSDSNIPSELMGKNGRRAIFACGSAEEPSVLTSYTPAKTVEESFKQLYPAYNFSTSGYTSMKLFFSGSDTVTLSEDGETAYCSVVMDESYTEKVINGKPVTILMINSEYKYSFRAPKITFVKDEDYVTPSDIASPSDAVSSDEPVASTTSTTSTTAYTGDLTAAATAPLIESTTASDAASTTSTTTSTTASTTVSTTASSTTVSQTTTSSSSAATTQKTTVTTTSTKKSTTSTTASTTTSKTTVSTTSGTNKYIKPTTPTTAPATTNSNPIFTTTTINSLSSQRGIVNTRRLPLNIRSGPGKSYMVVTVLPRGAYVTVLDTQNPDWYMVKTMGKVVGYAYSEYIRIM